ncbi:MAG: rhodanese-like domain-containing protein [Proteobacteria bacterium]|nr:rhodanese-like domain-containing protein [Pseudomonadota bacterium]
MSTPFDLTVYEVKKNQNRYTLVDVREAYELRGPEGHIEDTTLATLGSDLTRFLQEADPQTEYVFICLSGGRSGKACLLARAYGLTAYNMAGGMKAWKEMEALLPPPSSQ